MCAYGATWGHMGPYCPLGGTSGHLEPSGANMCSHGIRALFGFSRYCCCCEGLRFCPFCVDGPIARRICEACLFTKGEWDTGTIGGRGVQAGQWRYWNNALCRLITPYNIVTSSVESGALLIVECRIVTISIRSNLRMSRRIYI